MNTIVKKACYFLAIFPLLFLFMFPQLIMSRTWGGQEYHPWPQALMGCLLVVISVYIAYRVAKYWGLIQWDRQFFSGKTVVMLAVAYALAFTINHFSTIWLETLGKTGTVASQAANNDMKQLPLVFNFLASACLPAIFEELICRGIMMKKMFGFGRYKWLGLILSSLIFGALHMPTNLPSWIIYTSPGLIMGYMYLKTDNLAYPVTLHFINNFAAVLLFYLN